MVLRRVLRRGLVGLVEQMLFTTDPRPYENVAGCDWLDAKDPDWLDPQAPAPDLPQLHSPKDRLILRAYVAALMDRRSMLSSITPKNCYGQYTSGAWAVGLPTMRVLGDLVFEIVVSHTFCTEESCE